MSHRLRLLTGLLTVVVFGFAGATLWSSGNATVGGALLVLAGFRLAMWARDLRDELADEPEG